MYINVHFEYVSAGVWKRESERAASFEKEIIQVHEAGVKPDVHVNSALLSSATLRECIAVACV